MVLVILLHRAHAVGQALLGRAKFHSTVAAPDFILLTLSDFIELGASVIVAMLGERVVLGLHNIVQGFCLHCKCIYQL